MSSALCWHLPGGSTAITGIAASIAARQDAIVPIVECFAARDKLPTVVIIVLADCLIACC